MGSKALEVANVTVVDPRGHQVVKDVSFEAHAGEVLGIAGVQGNGQTELIKSLLGLIRPDAGTITLDGEDISKYSPARQPRRRHRLHPGGPVPRRVRRLVQRPREPRARPLPPATSSRAAPRCGSTRSARTPTSRIKEFDIRTETMETPVSSLSGGNQQKVVVAREFSRPLKVLIASQPTRGVDVGLHRVHPQADHRGARPRHRGDHRLHRARRDLRAVRPDRGDVRRPDRRHRHAPTSRARRSA